MEAIGDEFKNIVLKDKNGSPIEHDGVRYLHAKDKDLGVVSFMRTDHIGCYYGIINKVSDGVYTFTVTGQWFASYGSSCVYGEVNDGMCKEYGKLTGDRYVLIIMFTHKPLDIGETYYTSEL